MNYFKYNIYITNYEIILLNFLINPKQKYYKRKISNACKKYNTEN